MARNISRPKDMPELIDMSAASLYPTIPLLPDYDAYAPLAGSELYGMEGLPLRRAMLASDGLDDHCSLGPLQDHAMDYEQ
ncbi:hypothetical protein BaRGS_00027277, partial [Batillaria attramentaria]